LRSSLGETPYSSPYTRLKNFRRAWCFHQALSRQAEKKRNNQACMRLVKTPSAAENNRACVRLVKTPSAAENKL